MQSWSCVDEGTCTLLVSHTTIPTGCLSHLASFVDLNDTIARGCTDHCFLFVLNDLLHHAVLVKIQSIIVILKGLSHKTNLIVVQPGG